MSPPRLRCLVFVFCCTLLVGGRGRRIAPEARALVPPGAGQHQQQARARRCLVTCALRGEGRQLHPTTGVVVNEGWRELLRLLRGLGVVLVLLLRGGVLLLLLLPSRRLCRL